MVSVLTLAGMARVIVENTTFPKAEGAVWEGTLTDTWIELTDESTMMGCVVEALDGHTVVGAESNYISSIDNLKAFDGGTMSGWMGTLNDWFTNFGFGEFTVAKGTLCAGDEIRIMYTRTVEDLGGSFGSTDTRLKALTFSTGKLAPKFSGDTFTYTLTVPEGTTSLLVITDGGKQELSGPRLSRHAGYGPRIFPHVPDPHRKWQRHHRRLAQTTAGPP